MASLRNGSSVLNANPTVMAANHQSGATRNRSIESGHLELIQMYTIDRRNAETVKATTSAPFSKSGGNGALSTSPANKISGRTMPPMSSMPLDTRIAFCLRRAHDQAKNTRAMNSSTSGWTVSGMSTNAKSRKPSTPTNVSNTPR